MIRVGWSWPTGHGRRQWVSMGLGELFLLALLAWPWLALRLLWAAGVLLYRLGEVMVRRFIQWRQARAG